MVTKATNSVLNLVSPPIDNMVLSEGTLNDSTIGLTVPAAGKFTSITDTGINSPLVGAPSGLLTGVELGTTLVLNGNVLDVNSSVIPTIVTGSITVYVATTGSDSNTGLSPSDPFLTIQHAVNYLFSGYQLNGGVAVVQVASGVYSSGPLGGGCNVIGKMIGAAGSGQLLFIATGGIVTINGNGLCFGGADGAAFSIYGSWLFNTSFLTGAPNAHIVAAQASSISIGSAGINYGSSFGAHLEAVTGGTILLGGFPYSVSGNGTAHIFVHAGGQMVSGAVTVTVTGAPNFTTAFALATELALVEYAGATFIGGTGGSVTRYIVNTNSVLNTNGGGASYFPGNVPGTTVTGGVYE